jgi:hypothetical protein
VPSRPILPAALSTASARNAAVVLLARRAAHRLDLEARAARFTREVSLTLAAVLLIGVGAASAEPVRPAAAPAAAPSPVAVASPSASAPAGPPARTAQAAPAHDLPAPAVQAPAPSPVAAAPAAPPAAVERWLPTGTGMWLHDWNRSQGGDAQDVVARSMRSGFTHLYVQTGSTKKGWIGEEVLSELLPATRHTPIKVIAWDFPKLIDPEADARRMVRAATWSRPNTATVAAVAPDIETAAEGTRISAENVTRYYRELRRLLPKHVPILATVPWPSEKRTDSYPYAATAPWSDAIIPMAYWYNRDPAVVTATSMAWLARFGKPVMPVGQGYDGRIDVPYLAKDPDLAGSVTAFIDTARQHEARSISLWSWQTTEGAPWTSLAKAAGTIGPQPAPPATPAAPAEAVDAPADQAQSAPGGSTPPGAGEPAARRQGPATAPGRRRDQPPGQGGGR